MKTFTFYQDYKVSVEYRQYFEIEARNYQSALKKVEKYKREQVEDDLHSCDRMYMHDYEELMTPEENGGYATIELYSDEGEPIGSNQPE